MYFSQIPLTFISKRCYYVYSLEHKFYYAIRPTPFGESFADKKMPRLSARHFLVEEGGFEPPKLTQQIYSLPPLATRELLHMNFWKVELVDGFEPPTC